MTALGLLDLRSLRQAGPVEAAVGLAAPVTGTGMVTLVLGTSIKDIVIIGTAVGGPTALVLAGGGTLGMSSGSGLVSDVISCAPTKGHFHIGAWRATR